MMSAGRVLLLHGGGPAENMAVDQALLESVDRGAAPTLRLYHWDRPTLSLGYFQKLADRRLHAPSESLACVRRATGGGAIVHHHELTYSLALAASNAEAGSRGQLYHRVHQVAVGVLRTRGVGAATHQAAPGVLGNPSAFLCFQRRTEADLVVSGYKVLGSAQRRGRRAVLQHGSWLLRASRHAPELPGIADLASRSLSAHELAGEFTERLGKALQIDWSEGELSMMEQQRASEIVQTRFDAPSWHTRR